MRPGQRVIAPFAFSDGTCDYCLAGLHTSCRTGRLLGRDATTAARARPCARRSRTAPSCRCPTRSTSPTTASPRPSPPSPTSWARAITGRSRRGRPGRTAVGRRATARSASARCWPPAGWAPSAIIVARPPRRPAGHRPALRRHRRRHRARRRGGRAGAGAHGRGRGRTCSSAWAPPASFDTAIGSRPPGRRGGPPGRAGRAGRPAATCTCATCASSAGSPRCAATSPSSWTTSWPAASTPPRSSTSPIDLDDVPGGYAAMDERRAIKVLVRVDAA